MITTVEDITRLLSRSKKLLSIEVRVHKTISGSECFRLVDKNKNPIANISKQVASSLLRKGIIKSIPDLPKQQTSLFNEDTNCRSIKD